MAKKEIPLNPEITEQAFNNNSVNDEDLKLIQNNSNESSDSFFKHIVKELYSKDNISLKTEYLSVTENFAGVKLEYLSKYGNMPYLSEFIEIFEKKRVSLERKGRKEILMALQNRQEEIQQEKLKNIKGVLGLE